MYIRLLLERVGPSGIFPRRTYEAGELVEWPNDEQARRMIEAGEAEAVDQSAPEPEPPAPTEAEGTE